MVIIFSCKQNDKTKEYKKEILEVPTSIYPKNISKVFEAHGGLTNWNALQSLEFTMEKPNGNEITITNLKSRKSLINTPNHTIGFDGNELWLLNKDSTAYKGDAKFYYNLMFYFYAMPFVLADDGIVYKNVEPITFEGKTYPGIHISYNSGVGESPEDEYILYYDKTTNKMAWLAYTVTYFSKEKAQDFHLIKYDTWQMVNGMLLPKTLKWYGFEHKKVGEFKREMSFVKVSTSQNKPEDSMFIKPNNAETIE